VDSDIQKVLIKKEHIAQTVRAVGEQIADDLGGLADVEHTEVTLVPILTGSIIFLADLIRHLPLPMQIHVLSVSSYPGTATESQGVNIPAALDLLPESLEGRHVLIVDDILDSGRTLSAVARLLEQRGPESVKTCVLLEKERERDEQIAADYACFRIPDEFVVGYGLDYNGYYRNLPEIAVLTPEAIERHRELPPTPDVVG